MKLTDADVQALRKLRDEFEQLIDPARDDMLFIYDWAPPEWYVDFGWIDSDRAAIVDVIVLLERVLLAISEEVA